MGQRGLRKLAGCLALVAGSTTLVGAVDVRGQFDSRILAAHNRERDAIGVEPLAWNSDLAASARRWAEHLARSGRFEHDLDPALEEGENLWEGTRGAYSLEEMVDGWVREKRHFHQGAFPDNSTTGNWEDVGHYTQLVWRETRQVGCALVPGRGEDVLVCRYSQPGNYEGERPF
jgi:hypothetical protein